MVCRQLRYRNFNMDALFKDYHNKCCIMVKTDLQHGHSSVENYCNMTQTSRNKRSQNISLNYRQK